MVGVDFYYSPLLLATWKVSRVERGEPQSSHRKLCEWGITYSVVAWAWVVRVSALARDDSAETWLLALKAEEAVGLASSDPRSNLANLPSPRLESLTNGQLASRSSSRSEMIDSGRLLLMSWSD